MSGKHAAPREPNAERAPEPRPRPRRRRLGIVIAAVVVALAATATATAFALRSDGNTPAAAGDPTACTGVVRLSVLATPAIAPVVTNLADEWAKSVPLVGSKCITVGVEAADSAQATQQLATAPTATLWIPDSTLWSGKLSAAAPSLASSITVGSSLGSSPLVLATAPDKATELEAAADSNGWAGALSGPVSTTLIDPATSAAGALMVLGLNAGAGNALGAAAQLVGLYIRLQSGVLKNADAGFAALQQDPNLAPAFVTTEVDVFHANLGREKAIAAAVYPSGPTASLDFPLVRVLPPGSDPELAAAASQFQRQLTSPQARKALSAAGLRDSTGAPLQANSAAAGVSSKSVSPGPATITPAQQDAALRLWSAAVKPSHLLAVVDVSGSMANDSGTGRSKIQVATDAATTALSLVPANWALGLWAFSQQDPPATDYTSLVPISPISSTRGALIAAARTLPSRVRGNTALYDTALAAFENVRQQYDPSAVNVVALLTDGTDVDPDGMDLSALVSRLKAEYDPARPVKIVTIAFGADADAGALQQISAATHAQSYVVKKPEDIRGVLLDSIIANN